MYQEDEDTQTSKWPEVILACVFMVCLTIIIVVAVS